MKVLKWLVFGFFGLILALVLYLTLLFDLNDFKPDIIEQVKTQTGRTLVINDELNWTFFPTLGIRLGGISFSNPDGIAPEQMMSVDSIVAEVALMPLFSKKLEIGTINLQGLTVNLVTASDGKTSFDGLAESKVEKPSAQSASTNSTGKGVGLAGLEIGGVIINNAIINVVNQQLESTQRFSLDSLTLGAFSLGQASELAFNASGNMSDLNVVTTGKGSVTVSEGLGSIKLDDFKVETELTGKSLPNGKLSTLFDSDIDVNLDGHQANLDLDEIKLGTIEGNGNLRVGYGSKVPNIDLQLSLGDIYVNDWIVATDDPAPDNAKQDNIPADKEPDLSALKTVNVTAEIDIKSVNKDKLKTEDWKASIVLNGGVLDIKNLSGEMYNGKLELMANIDGRSPVARYQFQQSLSGVDIRPLLTDAAELDFLSGEANLIVKGTGYSLIPDSIKNNLKANGNFAINDGSLYGVNIPSMIRSAEAKLKGNVNKPDTAEQKTDFTSLTGNFTMEKGVVTNPDLNMESPLIHLAGKGNANVVKETIDYQLSTSVATSLEGKASHDSLKGLAIPLAITGSFAEPKFALDTKALVNNKVKDELKKQEDKLKNKLLKKLGGW